MRKSCDSSMYWCSSSASARADSPSWPNGFSTTIRAVLRQAGLREPLDDPAEEERRDLEVEDRALGAVDRVGDALVGGGVGEVALRRTRAAPRSARTPPRRAARRCRRSSRGRAATSWSIVQSSTATPTIGQSSSPRCSSRYSEWNVITLARSPGDPEDHEDVRRAVVRRRAQPRRVSSRSVCSLVLGNADPARALVREPAPAQSTTAFARSSFVGRSARCTAPQANCAFLPLHRPSRRASARPPRRVRSSPSCPCRGT